jgi:hypothetical protein
MNISQTEVKENFYKAVPDRLWGSVLYKRRETQSYKMILYRDEISSRSALSMQ